MGSEKPQDEIDKAVSALIDRRESITFAQLKRILSNAIPLRLSGTLLITLGSLLVTALVLGWQGHGLWLELKGPQPSVDPPHAPLLTPTETVQLYFTLLDQGHDDKAWQMYAPSPEGENRPYAPWKAWWTRIERVAVKEVVPLRESSFLAVVGYRLELTIDGENRLDEPSNAELVRTAKDQPWKILRLVRER